MKKELKASRESTLNRLSKEKRESVRKYLEKRIKRLDALLGE